MIRSLALLLLVSCITVAADDKFEREYQRAAGTWKVTKMYMNGEEIPAEGFKETKFVIQADMVKALEGEMVIAEGKYKIVSVKNKRVEFDLTMQSGPDKGKKFPALNEWVDDNTIRTSIAQPDKPRPVDLTTEKGDRRAVFTIQREKK